MRAIKFRGKDAKSGEWLYGSLIQYKIGETAIAKFSRYGYECSEMKKTRTLVDPATVGQFTGLQDAHGTDVYEGDIVRYQRNNKTYQVVFKDGIFWGEGENGNGCAAHFFPSCEIVGNVIDNPELIEKGGSHE